MRSANREGWRRSSDQGQETYAGVITANKQAGLMTRSRTAAVAGAESMPVPMPMPFSGGVADADAATLFDLGRNGERWW